VAKWSYMQEQIEKDLKQAMLSGDKTKAEILRGLKSAMQYEAVSLQSSDRTLNDEQVQKVLAREAKKRQDTAEIYKNANEIERADKELSEKTVIDAYLPEKLSEEDIGAAVAQEIEKSGAQTSTDMGRVIGAVRAKLGAAADGAVIARLVKEKLSK
jgi:uncharacterized protein YqeY